MYTSLATLAFIASASAKPPSNTRTYAVNYFYGTEPLLEGRYDPIAFPGELASHVHTIMGGSAFSMSMTSTSALHARCTNSKPKADNSNYWWPKLYFHSPTNGSFIDVPLSYAKAYYFFEPTDDETHAFPPGLRMVTGNTLSRAPSPSGGKLVIDPSQGALNPTQFVCITTAKNPHTFRTALQEPSDTSRGVGFPDMDCDGYTTPLRYDLHFPSCYDPGRDLGDYKHNMAFPSSEGAVNGQNCPEGWVHVPHLFIEVYWRTDVFRGLWTPGEGKQPFVLSSGDPTGYGLHGDFLAGWDEDALQELVDGCNAGDTGFDKCPGIGQEGGINDSNDRCMMQPLDDEVIYGALEKLPGCNPLQYGPGDAVLKTGEGCGGTYEGEGPGEGSGGGSASEASYTLDGGDASSTYIAVSATSASEASYTLAGGSASEAPPSETTSYVVETTSTVEASYTLADTDAPSTYPAASQTILATTVNSVADNGGDANSYTLASPPEATETSPEVHWVTEHGTIYVTETCVETVTATVQPEAKRYAHKRRHAHDNS